MQKVLETAQSRPESLEGIRFREKLTHFLLLIIRIIFENLKKGSETGSHHNDSSSTAEVLKEVSSISQSDFIIFLFSIILYVTKYGHIRCIDYNNNFFHYVYETKHRERPIQVFRKSLRLFLKLFRAIHILSWIRDPRTQSSTSFKASDLSTALGT